MQARVISFEVNLVQSFEPRKTVSSSTWPSALAWARFVSFACCSGLTINVQWVGAGRLKSKLMAGSECGVYIINK